MSAPVARMLPDGRRLHLQHGPIDLIAEAFGSPAEVDRAYAQAKHRFGTILGELVEELPRLRASVRTGDPGFSGRVARRMRQAVLAHSASFITPMAAVAGAVADEVLAALISRRSIERAYVNNGGDVGLYMVPGTSIEAAIAGGGSDDDRAVIRAEDPVRGLATSGWRGRSHSLGIADAVTVLARTAADADAAATVIANAVDLPDHPKITRIPALDIDPDSDLGTRLVTTAVAPLSEAEARCALDAGASAARTLLERGTIAGAALFLAGQTRQCGLGAAGPERSSPSFAVSRDQGSERAGLRQLAV